MNKPLPITPGTSVRDMINRPVFLISAGLIVLFCIYGSVFSEHAAVTFSTLQTWLVVNVGWFYMGVVAVFFGFVVYLAFSRFGQIKLGPDDSEPDYSYISWFAMLFSAGMGIGLMFYSVAEPVSHFLQPPVGEGGDAEAARRAMQLSFFHWGLQAWAIYIIVGLALAYFAFRHNLPLTIRSALYPIIGDRIYGPIGHAVDIFAVLGTMFGVATSLGIGVMQVNAGLSYLFDVPVGLPTQIVLIGIITAMATASVVAGLDAGIRRISELNLVLALILLVFMLIAGPTATLLGSLMQNIGMYASNMVEMTLTLYAYEETDWMGAWTLFYWAWWISWSPFVGMFIARISRGRTIREFITCVLLVPSGFTFMWLTFFGNTALSLELAGAGAGLNEAVLEDLPTAVFVLLEQLPLTTLMSLLTTLLVVTFFVTSSDSGSLVIDIITSGGAEDPPVWQRVFWAIAEGVVASVLLVAGGLTALQTAALTTALPFALIILLICYGLLKGLRSEAAYRLQAMPSPSMPALSTPGEWSSRLKALLGHHDQRDVQDYLLVTARPAMQEVAEKLREQSLEVRIEEDEGVIQIEVGHGPEQDFLYQIKLREYAVPSVAFPELPRKGRGHSYWRAEVFLRQGAQHYDVAGYTREQLVNDILAQFELHMQYLHIEL
ncbi:MAG: choline BCCT transporter BetT [Pseudohongiellaceae bacterium]